MKYFLNSIENENIRQMIRDKQPEANTLIARSLLWMSVASLLVWGMTAAKIINANMRIANVFMLLLPIVCILISITIIKEKGQKGWFKYLLFALLLVIVFGVDWVSGFRFRILISIPIILSARYYDKHFTWIICIFAIMYIIAMAFLNMHFFWGEIREWSMLNVPVPGTGKMMGNIYETIIREYPEAKAIIIGNLRVNNIIDPIIILLITMVAQGLIQTNLRLLIQMEEGAKREIEQQRELHEMETKIMLSQIKPHFLYNTLTTISVMCKVDPKGASKLTRTFSKFLRANMDSMDQKDLIPFEQELEHVKNYLLIEQARFEDHLKVAYDITCSDFFVPVLTVEPVVENAVKHGIRKKLEGGTVTISTEETDTAWKIIVSDDGVGFDPNQKKEDDGRSHLGMKNVIERLSRQAGADLKIDSTIGVGTVATITIPKDEKYQPVTTE